MKLGILFNGVVATALAVPILRYVLSSVNAGGETLILTGFRLGGQRISRGRTRLATFRNPIVMPADGKTVDTACWVRRSKGTVSSVRHQLRASWLPSALVSSIGIVHVPCTVWSLLSRRLAGFRAPERGLSNYPYKVKDGLITIQRANFPLPARDCGARSERPPCA